MNENTISDVGEKRLINEFIRPLFNKDDLLEGVGDDCAILASNDEKVWLFSTDRVPADLIAFRLGIIDYYGLGRYLAWLNISDIAACGGVPIALLLNLGLPNDLKISDFKNLCRGFRKATSEFDCEVIGGDISQSTELSISATAIGKVHKDNVLSRRNAQPGDTIFISRPLGLTPAAFAYYLRNQQEILNFSNETILQLNKQFTDIRPLASLGLKLSRSGLCTSCMDNTDGVGQSLLELSNASNCCFIVEDQQVNIPDVVTKISSILKEDALELALSAGADFSLVGTLNGKWTEEKAKNTFGSEIQLIGTVSEGNGVSRQTRHGLKPLHFTGWNYFLSRSTPS